jgi:hypothetical protein
MNMKKKESSTFLLTYYKTFYLFIYLLIYLFICAYMLAKSYIGYISNVSTLYIHYWLVKNFKDSPVWLVKKVC